MKKTPLVSIIIPAYNEAQFIGKCLSAIHNMKARQDSYEVIVVDNGSTDKTVEIAKFYQTRVFIKPGGTIASLRNFGAQQVRGDVLAFVDADCIVPEMWLSRIQYLFNRYDVASVGGGVKCSNDSSWVAKIWDIHRLKNQKEVGEVEWLPSGNLTVRRKIFDEIGGFDLGLKTNEDYDLCFRIKENGYKIYSDPALTCIHMRTPQTLHEFYIKERWHGKDVLNVFLQDIFKFKNWRSIFYAFYFLICSVGILASLILGFMNHNFLPLAIVIFLLLVLPLFISIKVLITEHKIKYLAQLTSLYFVYGISRAFCLLKTIFFEKIEQVNHTNIIKLKRY